MGSTLDVPKDVLLNSPKGMPKVQIPGKSANAVVEKNPEKPAAVNAAGDVPLKPADGESELAQDDVQLLNELEDLDAAAKAEAKRIADEEAAEEAREAEEDAEKQRQIDDIKKMFVEAQ